jgi:hypothetical protein
MSNGSSLIIVDFGHPATSRSGRNPSKKRPKADGLAGQVILGTHGHHHRFFITKSFRSFGIINHRPPPASSSKS